MERTPSVSPHSTVAAGSTPAAGGDPGDTDTPKRKGWIDYALDQGVLVGRRRKERGREGRTMDINDKRDLAGTTIVVTGASSGIGRAVAQLAGRAGANVVLAARRVDRLEAVAEEIGDARALCVPCDVTKPADCQRVVESAEARFGGVDSLVASAGLGMYGGIMDNTDEQLSVMMDVNYAGTVWAVRAAVPALRRRGGGDIVIVASVAGLRGGAIEAVYAGSKFAQVGLAGAIDRELRPEGIRVTTVAPAAVATEFAIGHGRREGDPWLQEVLTSEDVASAIIVALEQPRRLRTQLWSMWSMVEGS